MDVELIRWPGDRNRLDGARRQGGPRLLLVEPHESPPTTLDPLEDWVRVPAEADDVRIRVDVLTRRAIAGTNRPRLRDGVLVHRDRTVVVSEVESRLVGVLLDRQGIVVTRGELVAAGWPDGVSGRNTVDVAVGRLRRRLATVGLVLKTVRSRGYLLDPGESRPRSPSDSCQPTERLA